jgi:[NiFe] hydrogenase assembly HybE family chaperone
VNEPSLEALHARVEAAYARVAERMAGLPACNPKLGVELVGLHAWQGLYLGVLVTPWSINLLLLPGEQALSRLGADQRQRWRFPSGEYDFMGGTEASLGEHQFCSLISPPLEFAGRDEARTIALAALDALLEPADNTGLDSEAARLGGRSIVRQPLSRRGFLTGGLFSSRE